MELRELSYFVQVAKDKRFTKAAENLFISQPAISKSIRKLEKELNAQLFDMQPDGAHLTDCGKVLYEKAMLVLQEVAEIPEAIEAVKTAASGRVTIGTGPMLNALYGGELALQFYQKYPEIELRVVEYGSLTLHKMLTNHEIDIGIFNISDNIQDAEIRGLFEDVMVVCVANSNPLADRTSMTMEDLRNESFNLYSNSSLLYKQIIDACRTCGYTPKVSFSSSSIPSLINMTASGTGIFILPRPYAEHVIRPGLTMIPLIGTFKWTVVLGWMKNAYFSHAARLFAEHVENYFSARKCDGRSGRN